MYGFLKNLYVNKHMTDAIHATTLIITILILIFLFTTTLFLYKKITTIVSEFDLLNKGEIGKKTKKYAFASSLMAI
jgi:hypothetical protein